MTVFFGIIIVFFNGQLVPMTEPFESIEKCRAEVAEVAKAVKAPGAKVVYAGCVKSEFV